MSDLLEIIGSSSQSDSSKPSRINRKACYIIGIAGGTAAVVTLGSIPFLSPGLRKICLPFVPATEQQIVNVCNALRSRSGSVIDLGSGDGRVVCAAASLGFKSVGVELNLWLVLYSRINSYFKGVSHRTQFYRHNLWSFNISPYRNVVVFGTEEMMPELEKKCLHELEKDSCVITCRFPLRSKEPDKIFGEGVDTVWSYSMKKDS